MNLSQLDVRSNLNASSGSSIYLEDNKYFIPNFSNSNVSDFLASHVSLDIKEPKNFNVTGYYLDYYLDFGILVL